MEYSEKYKGNLLFCGTGLWGEERDERLVRAIIAYSLDTGGRLKQKPYYDPSDGGTWNLNRIVEDYGR